MKFSLEKLREIACKNLEEVLPDFRQHEIIFFMYKEGDSFYAFGKFGCEPPRKLYQKFFFDISQFIKGNPYEILKENGGVNGFNSDMFLLQDNWFTLTDAYLNIEKWSLETPEKFKSECKDLSIFNKKSCNLCFR